MKRLKAAQLKALSEFANMIAAAWFTAGVISPFFTKPNSLQELIPFLIVGLLMTWATILWSMALVEEI